jgi:hypothetical protein
MSASYHRPVATEGAPSMPFTLIKGQFLPALGFPDGDSVRFRARDKTLWAKLEGRRVVFGTGVEDEGHRAAPARRHRCDREGRDEAAVGRRARESLPAARPRRREGAGARRLHPRADDRRFVRPADLLRVPRRASEARRIVDHADGLVAAQERELRPARRRATRIRSSTTRCSRRCAPNCRKVMRSPSRRIVATGRPTRHGRA